MQRRICVKKIGARHFLVMPFLALIYVAISSMEAMAEPVANDETAIRQVLKSTWDKPESPLHVETVAIVSNHALAGWTQGARGGRALMFRNSSGEWMVQACGGDGLKEVKTLEQSSIPSSDAASLASAVSAAESKLPAATRALFSTFDTKSGVDFSETATHEHHSKH